MEAKNRRRLTRNLPLSMSTIDLKGGSLTMAPYFVENFEPLGPDDSLVIG